LIGFWRLVESVGAFSLFPAGAIQPPFAIVGTTHRPVAAPAAADPMHAVAPRTPARSRMQAKHAQ